MSACTRAVAAAVATLLLFGCSSGGGGSAGIGLLSDTDGDGLPDSLEAKLGSDPRNADSPTANGDQDADTANGPGPDAIPDALERYLFDQGSALPILARNDSDGDQIPDYLEVRSGSDLTQRDDPVTDGALDFDGNGGPSLDGVSDGLESYLLRRGAVPPLTVDSDSDGDGISDVLEVRSGQEPFDELDPGYAVAFDLDADGLPDWLEIEIGSDLLHAGFPTSDGADDDDGGEFGPDGDRMLDGLEGWLVRAGAQAPVTTASDSDGDGAPDYAEIQSGHDPFDADDPRVDGATDSDGDGFSNAIEELFREKTGRSLGATSDADRDGITDAAELIAGTLPLDATDPSLFEHFDIDEDGVFDFLEVEHDSDPSDPDDPLADGGEDELDASGPPRDLLSDALEMLLVDLGATAPVSTYSDSDGDGVPDFVELRWVSDPFDADSPRASGELDVDDATGPAGDGLSDAAEQVLIELGVVAPVTADGNADDDVIPNRIELVTGSNPADTESPFPNTSPDVDEDGLPDYLEFSLSSDPFSGDDPLVDGGLDSDADFLSDALEHVLSSTGTPLPVEPTSDVDGDGLYDYLEVQLASDRLDADHPVQNGGSDVEDRTGPAGDGLSDAFEHFILRGGATPPVTKRSDSDRDATPDHVEALLALDAFDPDDPVVDGGADSDGDAVPDSMEFVLAHLGAAEPVDGVTDSDADGGPDYLEMTAGFDAFDADDPLPGGAQDVDLDGVPDVLEHVLIALGARAPITRTTDTDVDGIPDNYEAISGTHPLNDDHPLPNGGSDLANATGPIDQISDGLEALLIAQGASAPVTRGDDSDLDGAPDYLEVIADGLPFDVDDPVVFGGNDPDADHLSSALEEVLVRMGAIPPLGVTSDSDGDGAPDHLEVTVAAHPLNDDVPVIDGSTTNFDSNNSTGPAGDGISDALERILVFLGCGAPVHTFSDTDLDGLPDYFEGLRGTNPLDGDSPLAGGAADANEGTGPAGDGISDGLEAFLLANGATGPVTLTTDTDADGVPDYFEVFKGSDPFDPDSHIAPGVKPVADNLTITGSNFVGRTLTASYRYIDADSDPEGETMIRWLRDGVEIPGETGLTHVVEEADNGTTLTFEVTPLALFSFPPETSVGDVVVTTRVVPIPSFPHGEGGPGGIPLTNVRLWLRSNSGVATEDDGAGGLFVNEWKESTSTAAIAVPKVGSLRPKLVTGLGPRGAPAVHFDGASALEIPQMMDFRFSVAAAFQTTEAGGSTSLTWEMAPPIANTGLTCAQNFLLGTNFGKGFFVSDDTTRNTQLTSTTDVNDGNPHALLAFRSTSGGRSRLYVDGVQEENPRVSTTAGLDCSEFIVLGTSDSQQVYWTGDLFELIVRNEEFGTVENRLLHHYFTGRVGTPITDSLYGFFATHPGDVAGIGRVGSGDQITEAEGTGIVEFSEAQALSDGDFLIWGTDLPEDFSFVNDAPLPFTTRLRRTWAYTLTDGGGGDRIGQVNVRFRLEGLPISTEVSDFGLLMDTDLDFSSATFHIEGATVTPDPLTISFTNVILPTNNGYFALACKEF